VTATPDQAATLRKKMVELLAVQGKTAEAIDIASRLVQENPKDPESRALRAALRLRGSKKEELQEALKEFNAVLPEMPNNPVLRYNMGEAHLALGDMDKAIVQLGEAIKNRPAYVPPKLSLGRIYLIKGEFAKAQQLADEVLKTNPNLVMAHILKAASLMGVNDFKAARTELTDLLKQKSDYRDAQYMLAQVNMLDRKADAAEEGFRGLVKVGDMRGVFGLVDVMLMTKRHEQAAQMLQKEMDRPEAAKNAIYARALRRASAMVAVAQGKHADAIPLYEALVKESPEALDLQSQLGDAYLRADKPDLAFQAFQKVRQAMPTDPNPVLYMAMALQKQNKIVEAQPLYEQIIKMSPDNAIALNNRAYYLMENDGDLEQALTFAQRAKQRMPNNPDVADTLGLVYYKKKLSDDAIKIFQGLVNQKPGHVTWRLHLAMAYEQKGDKLQARRECEAALRNKPTSDEERKIRDLMGKLG
jgi:tetratricopeptide (TPR) repeat protein